MGSMIPGGRRSKMEILGQSEVNKIDIRRLNTTTLTTICIPCPIAGKRILCFSQPPFPLLDPGAVNLRRPTISFKQLIIV